jgi:hypothetical protein
MSISKAALDRIEELLSQIPNVVRVDSSDVLVSSEAKGACIGWIAAASNIIRLVLQSDQSSSYIRQAQQLQDTALQLNYLVHRNVLAMGAMLKQLRTDINGGLLTTFERQVSAETYDDLVDHAEAYLEDGRKEPAGAIVGVVFEDTVRRLCRANDIADAEKTAEPLINALIGRGVLTKLEGKEAKAASDLRTSATHALWDNFNADQVRTVIHFTRRLLRDKLAG